MSLSQMESMNGLPCACGQTHVHAIASIRSGAGALNELPAILRANGAEKPFLVCDKTTLRVAGEQVCVLLEKAGFPCRLHVFDAPAPTPEESFAGSLLMHFDTSCDVIVGIGSGVVNDLCKLLAVASGRKYAIVATAPSMDGYASASSSLTRDGLKITLATKCPDFIIGDTDILKTAPAAMLQAGLGDMVAKYIALTEWHLSHVINGEAYCPAIASLVRGALETCVKNAQGLMRREDEAVKAVFDGLVISGVAMAYAGSSRPASGVEHYISHVWDMRGEAFGTPRALHGIQASAR